MTTPLLQIRGLKTHFFVESGIAKAVDDIDLDIRPGEVLGLVGESGSGKSVTALSILRLIPDPPGHIAAGEIWFQGRDLLSLSWAEIRRVRGREISMIFQEPMTSLNPVFTIGRQVMEMILAHEPTTSREQARARSIEILTEVGIPEPATRMDQYPHELSGGMRQRVMIAIALVLNPALLIADEPTTALDVTIQAQILDLLNDLKARFGMSVIFITHDLGVLAGIADRVAVMYGGKIVEHGDIRTIFQRPSHPYTQGLLAAVPHIDRPDTQLQGIPGAVPTATQWPPGCRFHPRCSQRIDRCSAESPPDVTTGSGHVARCWIAKPAESPDA
jgi:oligopeptide/dipeptide ABC transporter ATP-binding protein